MSIINEHEFHTFNWVDLVTTDRQGAMAFYRELMGWSFEEQIIDGKLMYTMVTRKGKLVAGLSEMTPDGQQGIPPHWNAYICVEDVRAAVAHCEALGAKALHPPIDVFEAGSMAIMADPQGAAFCLWQPKAHKGVQLLAEPVPHGAFLWAELNTSDVGAAKTFYGQAFGWDAENDPNNEAYTVFTRESVGYVAGMMEIQPEWGPVPPHWLVYFAVADTDAALQQVLALGGSKVTDGMEIPQGRFALVKDPQGAIFTIMTSAHG